MTIRLLFLSLSLAAAEQPGIGQLAWLAGCWEGQTGPVTVEEQWSKPAGNTMLGASRTLKGGATIFSEFMRITESDGKIVYMARIGTKAEPTPFTLIQIAPEVVFENAKHDFPQRILYRLNPNGSLLARIEGVDKGRQRSEDYPMRRVRCE